MCISLLAYILWDSQFRGFHLFRGGWRPVWGHVRQILGLGLPIGATLLCESGMFAGAVLLMGWIGTAELAAHAVAGQCAAVFFMVPLGIAQASTVRVGLAAGRHDMTGIARAGWAALGLGVGFMAGTGVLFLSLPKTLIGLFLDLQGADTAPVVQLAIRYLAIAALFQLVDGAQVVGSSILRGLNDTRVPLGIAAVGYWGVGFGTAYLLGFELGMGGTGVWFGLAAGLAATALAFVWRFYQRERLGLLAAFHV
jgi:MATE family multidrug resistance protein